MTLDFSAKFGPMRYGIFSDIHSNLEALDKVIAAYRQEAIDKYLCVGDLVGYAANPRECIQKVKTIAAITVAGNHDFACADLFSLDYFNLIAKEAILWTQKTLGEADISFLQSLKLVYTNEYLTLAHGTLDAPGDFDYMIDDYVASKSFALQETNICFVGHVHVPAVFIKDRNGLIQYSKDNLIKIKKGNKYIINVGSVGQPRDGNPDAAYCIYDNEKKEVQVKRVKYDIQKTRKKIIDAGLPVYLGDRLLSGR